MTQSPPAEHLDVVVVGAGLSGIGAGYRLSTEQPGRSYAILESRDDLGGTWDLFRYPGVRSDSDMYTLGYSFEPWTGGKVLADGPAILEYVRGIAQRHGIADRIRYRTRVVAADFDTATSRWTLTVERREASGAASTSTLTCSFLYACAGYYDYEQPHAPQFAGTQSFAGRLVHPQFWPQDLDHAGARVVVIGSGATAVTLVPAMATGPGAAAHVTMLQRTPTWIAALPSRDVVADALRKVLPAGAAHRASRAKNIAFSTAFYQFCRRRPKIARRLLLGQAAKALGDAALVAEHFTPPYDPWDQRLCAVPDGDLFRAVRSGRADVVTDQVEEFVPEGVRLRSGRVLPADIVVTATGLRLKAFGGIALHVDGVPVDLPQQFVFNGAMITGVPNFAVCIGYTNASWTLRADLTHRFVCRVLAWTAERGYAAVEPRPDRPLTPMPLLDLAAGYVQRSVDAFPRQGGRAPWRVRQNYVLDAVTTPRADLARHLAVTPAGRPRSRREGAPAAG